MHVCTNFSTHSHTNTIDGKHTHPPTDALVESTRTATHTHTHTRTHYADEFSPSPYIHNAHVYGESVYTHQNVST